MADLPPVAEVGPIKLKIFISYRRSDTEGYAGRLYEALRRRFGATNIFMDVDTVRPGQDFVEALESAVAQCDVLLAVIGRDWLSAESHDGTRRLDDQFDYVRLEIAWALASNKHVIPVLFGDARMPHSADLPEPLQPLARRHAMAIRHDRFKSDSADLMAALKRLQVEKVANSEHERGKSTLNEGAGHDSRAEVQRQAEAESQADAELHAEIARQAEVERQREIEAQAEVERQREAENRRELASLVRRTPAPETADLATRGHDQSEPVTISAESTRERYGKSIKSGVQRTVVRAGLLVLALALALYVANEGLFAEPCDGALSAPSPSSKYTAYWCHHNTPKGDIWISSPGQQLRNVTNSVDEDESFPRWHPYEDVLLFVSFNSTTNDGVINIFQPGGADPKRSTGSGPAWSPDGTLIAFQRVGSDNQSDIWVMDSSGGSQRPVTSGSGDDSAPEWIDVDSIGFSRQEPGTGTKASFVVNVDGSDLRPA